MVASGAGVEEDSTACHFVEVRRRGCHELDAAEDLRSRVLDDCRQIHGTYEEVVSPKLVLAEVPRGSSRPLQFQAYHPVDCSVLDISNYAFNFRVVGNDACLQVHLHGKRLVVVR